MNHTKCGQGTMYFVTTVWIVPIQVQPQLKGLENTYSRTAFGCLEQQSAALRSHYRVVMELENRLGRVRNVIHNINMLNILILTKVHTTAPARVLAG